VAKPKHLHLLDDPDVRRWYDNVARGSIITADERLRRLGRFCETTKNTPKSLIEKKQASPGKFDDFIMDFVSASLNNKKEKPAQVKNNLTTIKSWLGHFGLKIDKVIKLPASDGVDEIVPTKEQLARILRYCDPRARVIAALLAFCGVRPESLGNYVGDDGLRLKDIPELKIEKDKVVFLKVPTIVIIRKTLSKARHQYFTFLHEEGCQYLTEFLESRIKSGESLTAESPVIGHIRTEKKLDFLRTTKLSWEVKKAIKAAGFSWRPYVLRSYCDTAFDIAESKGLVSHPWRQFFMGHKGDIEARYSTNKRLPPSMVDEMRDSYKKCVKFLRTSGLAEEEDRDTSFRKVVLVGIGYGSQEVDKWDVANLSEEAFQAKVREKLLGQLANNGARQKVVQTAEEARSFIGQGWEFAGTLPNGDIVVKLP
jgi:integrase